MSDSTSNSPEPFQSLNLAQVQNDLIDLYRRVACQQGRVEIVDQAGECDCVLISKVELESLEKAIALLSSEENVRDMSRHLSELASLVDATHAGA